MFSFKNLNTSHLNGRTSIDISLVTPIHSDKVEIWILLILIFLGNILLSLLIVPLA